jgi:hypothetical protein
MENANENRANEMDRGFRLETSNFRNTLEIRAVVAGVWGYRCFEKSGLAPTVKRSLPGGAPARLFHGG